MQIYKNKYLLKRIDKYKKEDNKNFKISELSNFDYKISF